MNSVTDETIFQRGLLATIIRDSGDIETYTISEITGEKAGRRRLEPALGFDHAFWFMSDSEAKSGDLIRIDTDYYLVMALEPKYEYGELEYYRGTLYKCNSVVTIYTAGASGKDDTVVKAGVKCLITQVRGQDWDVDRALALPNRSYRGSQKPFQVYMRGSEGLERKHSLVDQDERRYKVSKDFDVFTADGITQTECLWERT